MTDSARRDRIARAAGFLLSLALSQWLLWRHEFWHDEAQAILVATRSPTIGALLSRMGYEGTPALWYVPLWLVRGLPAWWDAKTMTALVTAAVLCVLFFRLRVGWPAAVLYALGVNLALYSFMSRSYELSVLLLLLFGALEADWRRAPARRTDILLAVVLFLLTQTNVHSVMIGAGIFLFLAGENLLRRRPVSWLPPAALALGAAVAALQLIPPPNGIFNGWLFAHYGAAGYVKELIVLPLRLLFPFYAPGMSPSVANVYGGRWLLAGALASSAPFPVRFAAAVVLATMAVLGGRAVLRRARSAGRAAWPLAAALITPWLALAFIGIYKYQLEMEQYYLLIPFGMALYAILAAPGDKKAYAALCAFLGLQLVGLAPFAWRAAALPYDVTPAVVRWVRAHGYGQYLADGAIAVFPDTTSSVMTLAADLPRGAYALSAARFQTFTPWDTSGPGRWAFTDPPRRPLPRHLPGIRGPYLLFTYVPLDMLPREGLRVTLLHRVPPGPWVHWTGSPGAFLYLVGAGGSGHSLPS